MDFSGRCRLCIEPKRLSIDIFSEEGRRIKLKSKISKHLSVKVSQSDGLPSQICYQCLYRLETWVSFKQLCMERDQVMKTWSQTYLDETLGEEEGAFNGGQNYCKGGNGRGTDAAPPLRLRSTSRDADPSKVAFASRMQGDDALSETSLWEVVKMDDGDTLESERQGQVSLEDVSAICSVALDSDQKHEWNRRKARKPSKTPSSSSETSNSNDIDMSCLEMSTKSLNSIPASLITSSACDKQPSSTQQSFSNEASPLPLKRKRGRPSKAFLQRERELKKIREQDKVDSNTVRSDVPEHFIDKTASSDVGKGVKDESISEVEPVPSIRPHVVTPDFTPVVRDDGSGVTEVVLDDPDVGSMKFLLSVVEVESPISSPTTNEDYKYYPESCASSCGNLCSDPLNREDFEGFESPNNSAYMKSMHMHDNGLQAAEMPRSRSQADIRFDGCGDILPAGIKRKRSNSASGDLRAHCSTSRTLSFNYQEEHVNVDNINTAADTFKLIGISKSFESLDDSFREKLSHEALEERNAYSDGEISESPNKRIRKKSLLGQEQLQSVDELLP